jgi:hypothetical protein
VLDEVFDDEDVVHKCQRSACVKSILFYIFYLSFVICYFSINDPINTGWRQMTNDK